MSKLRIGIIGLGGIANSVHIPGIQKSNGGEIIAVCDNNEATLRRVGDRIGIPDDHRFTDYRALIACPDVDAVEICTPNYLHVAMAAEAVRAGKPIHVEKPLSISLEKTKELTDALAANPVPNMMCFSYRYKSAVRYAKWILEEGLLGDVVSINVEYLKDSAFMPGRRLEWRFVKEYAGTGVLGDLGVHLIDMARFLIGDFKEVSADCGIVVKERKKLDSEEIGQVETDDYCNFIAKLEGGVAATFSITRCAIGQRNTIKYDIYGTKGVISFDLNHPEVLGVCVGEVDLKSKSVHTVQVPPEFTASQEQMFVDVASGKPGKYVPTIADGIACQKILDALLLSSEEKRVIVID